HSLARAGSSDKAVFGGRTILSCKRGNRQGRHIGSATSKRVVLSSPLPLLRNRQAELGVKMLRLALAGTSLPFHRIADEYLQKSSEVRAWTHSKRTGVDRLCARRSRVRLPGDSQP